MPHRLFARPAWREIGIGMGVALVAALAGLLWTTKGLAVYLEAIAAGLATCF
jgi:hypothetical protein